MHFAQKAIETVSENPSLFDRIIEIVERFGFPILVCGALFWYLITLEKQHRTEVDSLRTVLEQNTLAITKLVDKLGE